jgi:type I restriction enzyme S subunit
MKAQETKTIPKGYKQTEVGVIPEDWDVKKLGEISRVIMGQSPGSENYNCERVGLPLIQGNADVKNRKTIDRVYTRMITKRGVKGNVIMSVRAPVGEISKATFDCCLGRGVCAIDFSNNYLYHYLINFEKSWKQFSKGSTFDSINSKEVRELEIVLPSSEEEQTDIATILSDTDTLIENLEKLIAKKKAVKQGAMQELLTGKRRLPGFSREWEKKRLGDVVNLQGGYSFQSNKFQKSGVPIIRISNIYEKLISLEVLVYYPSIKIPNEFIIKKGDVLIAMSGATTGKAGVYNYSFSSYQNQRVGKFVVCDLSKNDNGYIAQLVQSDLFLAGLKKEIAQGAQPNISGKQIESIELDFPLEINEQKAIAELLSNMDSDINLLELKLKKYKQIKIGMMQQLLTGKIRIYDKQKS